MGELAEAKPLYEQDLQASKESLDDDLDSYFSGSKVRGAAAPCARHLHLHLHLHASQPRTQPLRSCADRRRERRGR